MLSSIVAIGLIAFTSSVSAQSDFPYHGGQCPFNGWQHCKNQGAWGCIQLEGPNCVDQTTECDQACGNTGYAYQKDKSDDRTCVCSFEDASQPQGGLLPPPPGPPLRGGQCDYFGLRHCQQDQGAWGCVQLEGPNCVDQTTLCDAACDYSGYAYQKDMSDDRTCVCSYEDASQAGGFSRRSFRA